MNARDRFKYASKRAVSNESGMVLVTTMLIMVILLIIGTVSVVIRNTEQRIVRNTEIFQNNFYALEGTTLEGVAHIANTDDSVLSSGGTSYPTWLKIYDPATMDLRDNTQWPSGVIQPEETGLDSGVSDITPPGYTDDTFNNGNRIGFSSVDKGICGGSLTDPTKQERCYDVYGMYDVDKDSGYSGKMMMLVGYKKVIYL